MTASLHHTFDDLRGGRTVLESQTILIVDDNDMLAAGLAAGLQREGRTLITCGDLPSAELVVERFQPSHIVADVRLSGLFGYEGLDLLPFVDEHAPETPVILMSGDGSHALQSEASARGAAAFFAKPFDIAALDAKLDATSSPILAARHEESRILCVPSIDEIVSSGKIAPHFQPIVALDGTGGTVGYESLLRYSAESLLGTPDLLFRYAARMNRIPSLEFACLRASAKSAVFLPGDPLIFLNVHPETFKAGGKLVEVLERAAERSGLLLNRVVLEITEQALLSTTPKVFEAIDGLRSLGARFAFDDVGVAYSHLPLINKVRPSFLKISQAFGMDFESDATHTKIIRNILSLAKDFDCEVVVEGIEQASTAYAAAELGIAYGQGFYFGRPAPIEPAEVQ